MGGVMSKRNDTEENKKKDYGPDVYARLELVRKQFQNNVARQKKQQAVERRQRFLFNIKQHKAIIVRITVYVLLSLLVLAVIGVTVFGLFSK